MEKCCICNRELGDVFVDEHHLVPKTFKGKETIRIHKICHAKIHHTFSEKELQQYYHTPQRLVEHEEIQKFIKWIAKRPLEYYDKNNDTKARHSRR